MESSELRQFLYGVGAAFITAWFGRRLSTASASTEADAALTVTRWVNRCFSSMQLAIKIVDKSQKNLKATIALKFMVIIKLTWIRERGSAKTVDCKTESRSGSREIWRAMSESKRNCPAEFYDSLLMSTTSSKNCLILKLFFREIFGKSRLRPLRGRSPVGIERGRLKEEENTEK